MALHRLTLERDAQLRQSALLHAHQVDSARMAYEQEKNKVEDEARNSKKLVREKLLAAVEDRRRRLREDKEGGEGMSGAWERGIRARSHVFGGKKLTSF